MEAGTLLSVSPGVSWSVRAQSLLADQALLYESLFVELAAV
jgi:hypothetical protein